MLNLGVSLLVAFFAFSHKKFAYAKHTMGYLATALSAWSGAELARGLLSGNSAFFPIAVHASLASFFIVGALYFASAYKLFVAPYIPRGLFYTILIGLGAGVIAAAIPGVLVNAQNNSGIVSLTSFFHLGIALWFLVVGGLLHPLRRAYAAAANIAAARISIFTIAGACLIAGFFSYVAAWYGSSVFTALYMCISLFIVLAAYAAFAEHVTDIHMLISQLVVYGLSMLGVLAISSVLLLIVQSDAPSGFTFETLAIIAISLLFLPFLVRLAARMQGSITDIRPNKFHAVLREKIKNLITILDLESLAKECMELLKQMTTASSLALLIRSGETHNLEVTYGEGFDVGGILFEPANNPIVGILMHASAPLAIDAHGEPVERGAVAPVVAPIARALSQAEISMLVPVTGKRGLIGCIVLGKKTVGSRYMQEEIELLEFFASELAVALENARVYRETKALSAYLQNMNTDLVKKVETATAELKVKNEALERANQKLEEMSELKTDFLNMASHQFKTPTTVIRGMLSMIEKKEVNEATRDSFIHKMREAADRLNNLITDFLNTAKIEGGGLMLKFETANVIEFVGHIVDELVPLAQKKQLELKIAPYAGEKINAEFDLQRMHEALYNFVDNAIKYTPSGSVRLAFSLSGDKWTLEVADTGIGIPAVEIKKLFQKFYRTEGAARETSSGTGLGLYVAKKIIEEHGGAVSVRSPGLGKGTTFVITMPLHRATPAAL